MSKKIAYGVSVWARGLSSGHLDGIGIYTQALFNALKTDGVDIVPHAFGVSKPNNLFGEAKPLARRVSVHLVKAALFHQKLHCHADLFHATDHHIPRLDIPVVATVMDLIPFLHPEWVSTGLRTLKNWLFKKSILSADHLITISEQSKRDIVHHFGIEPSRISVTPLGVDPRYFDKVSGEKSTEILKRYQLRPGFFLFIGTLQPRKNIAHLLDGHALLPLAIQKRHPLVIVGRNGWGVDELLPRLKSLQNLGTVRWLDYVPQTDIFALLQNALALTFMSLYEGFGLPLVEAFAAGCPVIASNTTSIPEVAEGAALLLHPSDVDALKEAMLSLIDDAALSSKLIESGQARARVFTWEACKDATLSAYQSVL